MTIFALDASVRQMAAAIAADINALDDRIDGIPLSAPSWASITGKPTTFVPSAHTHAWAEVTGKPAFAAVATTGAYADLTGIPSTFAPAAHTHAWADVTGKPVAFAPSAHTHPWGEITGTPATYPPSAHSHAVADVTGLQATMDAKAALSPAINAQTGTAYSLTASDAGKNVTMNNAAANTVTIPTGSLPDGTIINVLQIGAGKTTLVGASGVTVNGTAGGSVAVAARWQGLALTKIGADAWVVSGGAA